MSIVLFRVDERLIHGQVVVGWGERLHMNRIVVIDDELSASAWEQELYRLGVPPGVDASFLGVEEARQAMPEWSANDLRIVILLRDVRTLSLVADGGALRGIEVNLGGIHHAPGRTRVLPYLHLSAEERTELERVAATGARVTARDLPASRPIPLADLAPDA